MKRRTPLIAMAVVALCSLLLSSGCKHHHSSKGTFALDYLSEALDLNPQQESELEAIRSELENRFEAMHKDKSEMLATVKEQLGKDRIDKAVIDKLIADHRAQRDAIVNLGVDKLITFHAGLNTEQRQKLLVKFEKFVKHCQD